MPNPKRRHSNQRTRKRRTHDKLSVPAASVCPNCHAPKKPHYVCPACGYYKGKPVVSIRQKEKKPKA